MYIATPKFQTLDPRILSAEFQLCGNACGEVLQHKIQDSQDADQGPHTVSVGNAITDSKVSNPASLWPVCVPLASKVGEGTQGWGPIAVFFQTAGKDLPLIYF